MPIAFLPPATTTSIPRVGRQRFKSLACTTNVSVHTVPTAVKRRDGSLPGHPDAKVFNVTFRNPKDGTVATYKVPEDRYIWHAMTEQGADLPSSCRNGCCTTCAAKLSSGEIEQLEALGLLKEMRAQGYALLCVSYPKSDIDCTLQDEDEVYVKQFGSTFESGGVEWGGVMPEDD